MRAAFRALEQCYKKENAVLTRWPHGLELNSAASGTRKVVIRGQHDLLGHENADLGLAMRWMKACPIDTISVFLSLSKRDHRMTGVAA